MDVLSPRRQPVSAPSSDGRTPTGWRTHLGRFAIALLAVAAVWSVGTRLAARDDRAPGLAAGSTDVAQTIEELEASARDRPDDPTVFQRLGNAYLDRSVRTLDPSYNDLAQRAFDRAEVLAPGDLVTTLGRAGLAATRHDFAEALAAADAVLLDNPFSATALAIQVDSEIELGRYEDAETHLQAFLDRRPGAAALARVSYFHELHGDVDGALVAIEDAEVAASSGSIYDRARLASVHGDVLLGAGELREATASYRRALRLVPELPTAVLGAARADALLGDRVGAIRSLDALVQRTPLPGAAMLLAELRAVEGDDEGAAHSRDLVTALATLERAAGSNVDLDLAVFEADNTAVDPATVQRATNTYANRPNIYAADALAWTLYRSGDAAAAAPMVEQALRTGTDDGQLRFHAAAVFAATGDLDRATAEMARSAQSNPWFSVARQDEARALAVRLGVDWPTGPPS